MAQGKESFLYSENIVKKGSQAQAGEQKNVQKRLIKNVLPLLVEQSELANSNTDIGAFIYS